MYQKVHEPVIVSVNFGQAWPQITSFTWMEREHLVSKVHLVTQANRGRELVWLFNVSTQSGAYKLRLDTATLQWWLEELTWELDPKDGST